MFRVLDIYIIQDFSLWFYYFGSMSIVGVEINPRVNKPNVKRGVFKFEGTFFCLADSFHEETVY